MHSGAKRFCKMLGSEENWTECGSAGQPSSERADFFCSAFVECRSERLKYELIV